MTAVTVYSYFAAQGKKKNLPPLPIFCPSIFHEVMRLKAMIFVFWMLSFQPASSLSSFTLFKRLFSFSLLSAIKWYLHIWGCWYFSQQSGECGHIQMWIYTDTSTPTQHHHRIYYSFLFFLNIYIYLKLKFLRMYEGSKWTIFFF